MISLCTQVTLIVYLTSAYSDAYSYSYLPPKQCPAGSVGTYPNCKCPDTLIGTPPNCQAPGYLPPENQKCPPGYYGTYPVMKPVTWKMSRILIFVRFLQKCREPCPPYHIGYKPECVRMKCLPGYEGEYQPDCVKVNCPEGEIGLYPNCVSPTTIKYLEVEECPAGQTGTPPNCRDRCPSFTYGEPPNCKKIKCPIGWEGDYQPNCQYKQKCPADKTGVWPNCVSQYCPPGSTGTYPNCKCRPGTTGIPPNCKIDIQSHNGYLPPYVQNGSPNQAAREDYQNLDLLPPNVQVEIPTDIF